jgi:hypothetical protein
VEGILLLGWMTREMALALLSERCLFSQPLSPEAASDVWARCRRRAQDLAARPPRRFATMPLSPHEELAVASFLEAQAQLGSTVRSVVKLDARELAVHQLGVTLDRTAYFNRACQTRAQWIEQWLKPPPTPIQGRVTAAFNSINVQVPHPEFVLNFDADRGFQVVEAPRFVSVVVDSNGPMLHAGHHRVYGYLSSPLAESDPSILAVAVSPGNGGAQCRSAILEGAEDVCARCPPTMADFLDERHAFRVKLRPRRFELQVRARMAVVAG